MDAPDAPKDLNPYAPMPASTEATSARAVPRWFAVLVGVLAGAIPGVGLLVLRRRRTDLWWPAAGLTLWLMTVFNTRSRFCLPFLAAMVLLWLAGLVVTARARVTEPQRWWRAIALAAVLFAVGGAFSPLVRAYVVEAFQIPAGSMIPSLLVGDHFFADKRARAPAHGDVVVFHYPLDPKTDYIKRVIGLPGETFEIRRGELLVDGQPLVRKELEGPCTISPGCELWEETSGTHHYRTLHERGPSGDFGPITIPPGTYFVLGDNRDNSNDSRVWGTVPAALVVGTATSIWFSRDPESGAMRWSRIGQPVE